MLGKGKKKKKPTLLQARIRYSHQIKGATHIYCVYEKVNGSFNTHFHMWNFVSVPFDS